MRRPLKTLLVSRRSRSVLWVLLLALGSVVLGVLAWREADRARRTADLLMRDYASFIAEEFVEVSAERYRSSAGLQQLDAGPEPASPIGALRLMAQRRDEGRPATLPSVRWPEVRYLFAYEADGQALETSGTPPPAEHASLLEILKRLDPECGASQTIVFGRLSSFGRERHQAGADWSGLLQTDARGALRRAYGLRVDERAAARAQFVRMITPGDDCACLKRLLPEGLATLARSETAVSFVLRDGQGAVVHRSPASERSGTVVTRPLSPEIPFAGWTIEVRIDPAAVRPLLPYAGRGAPWVLFALLGLLALTSAALAVRALRRDAELVRLRQDFVSNVSHELKTPLARIRLFNELLIGAKQQDPARRADYRRVIDRECRRLTFLVDNVLDFSRLERGAPRREPTSLDLRRVVEEALESFRAASDAGRLRLGARLEPVPAIVGDPQQLSQVVINLLDNAVKYSPEGSPIEVQLGTEDGWVRLAIKDRGCGIAEAERARIFEEFYRVESGDTQRVAGSGLGLALVRRTVEAHLGRVSVESQPGVGSTFVVRIPVTAETPRESPAGGSL